MKQLLRSLIYAFLLASCSHDPGFLEPETHTIVRVGVSDDPKALDPRIINDPVSINVAHMLFDGLFRTGPNGQVLPAIAEGYEISSDGKVYTFFLRESLWSDGTPLTAHDFEYAWKSILAPDFPAPFAYQLFTIEGARQAKIGLQPTDNIGVEVLDDQTLRVTLTQATPSFLELLTTHTFSPINVRWAVKNNKEGGPQAMPINGPFKIKKWERSKALALTRNPRYWDSGAVDIGGVTLQVVAEHGAVQMFEQHELDWVGSPMGYIPPDTIATLKEQEKLIVSPAAGIVWLRLNTEYPPLNNTKMRRALAYSLDRQAIINDILRAGEQPALGIIPPALMLKYHPHFEDRNLTEAWTYYQKALEEMGISKDDLPPITLSLVASSLNQKVGQAIQEQWNKALGVTINLEWLEKSSFYDQVGQQDYQIALGAWRAETRDPTALLDIFKYRWVRTNNTQWEDPLYIALLDDANQALSPFQRAKKQNEAEVLLMKAMPVIPLYFITFNHLQQPRLNGVYFSELGFLDFKYAHLSPL